MKDFDPGQQTSPDDGLFGLPCSKEESKIVIQQVPWEVTTSYGAGASLGPQSILAASHQLDLFHLGFGNAYRAGYFLEGFPAHIYSESNRLKELAQWVISESTSASPDVEAIQKHIEEINSASLQLNEEIYQKTRALIASGKIPGLLGGDHSVPYGHIQAVAESVDSYSILHIDAHHDLRKAYQGFEHSHASILFNVMESDFAPKQLVQVAIRDFCEEEYHYAKDCDSVHVFYDRDLAKQRLDGASWKQLCSSISKTLTKNVYITCDIDGLSPELCPHTGTPVPGGLSYQELSLLFEHVAQSHKIIGFDLVEVAPDPQQVSELDANVGARVLFELCGWTVKSQGLI